MANVGHLPVNKDDVTAFVDESDESSTDEVNTSSGVEENDHTNSKRTVPCSLKMRAQRHIVGRVVRSQKSIKPIIGRRASKALKASERLLKLHMESEAEVKSLMQAVIKTIAKIGLLVKQKVLNTEQLQFAQTVKQQFRTIALTVINFTRTGYTYDRVFLSHNILDCQMALQRCVTGVLSDNSQDRIKYIFTKLRCPRLLDGVFSAQANDQQRQALVTLAEHLETLVESSRKV